MKALERSHQFFRSFGTSDSHLLPALDRHGGDPSYAEVAVELPAAAAVDGAQTGSQADEGQRLPATAPTRNALFPDGEPPTTGGSNNAPTPNENGDASVTATVAATGNQIIDGILSGVRWNETLITYSDTDSPADYQAGYNSDGDGDGVSAQNEGFSQFTAQQMIAFHFSLNQATYTQPSGAGGFSIEGFTNIFIDYAGAGSGGSTIRGANSSDPGTAYAYYPNGGIYGGDTFFGNGYDGTSNSYKTPVAGNYAWHTMLHELGHSMGLKHGHETGGYGALPTNYDSIEFSVMTYRGYEGGLGYSYEQFGAPQTYMMIDILALQTMYGADFTVNGGNTVYTWSPTGGESYVDGVLAIDPGANRIFSTIWDGNGTDTYDLSNYTTALRIDLRPGEHSTFSAAQLANLGGGPNGGFARGNVFNAFQFNGDSRSLIENANGGSGNDIFTGNETGNTFNGNNGNDTFSGLGGNDTIFGGAGNDVMDGGSGVDLLYGNAGNDTFRIFSGWTGGTGEIYLGGAGIDVFDASQSTVGSAFINLEDGEFTYTPGGSGTISLGSIENAVSGSGTDVLTGSAANNVLRAGAGNDQLNGRAGADTMYGGLDNDTYWVDHVGDIIGEGATEGTLDQVNAWVSYVLNAPARVESLQAANIAATTALNLTGNGFGQSIGGNARGNIFTSLGGLDTIQGRGGNDIFIFSSAVDTGVGATRDVIVDFEDFGNDETINLGGFAGTLTYIAGAAFTAANQVRAVTSGANVLIQINTAGTTGAEGELLLSNTTIGQINASDFYLA